jgi:hypothetical protein
MAVSAFRPVVDSVHPPDGLADAFRHQESRRHLGKICLELWRRGAPAGDPSG